jgi:hypothetical protein
MFCVSGPGLWSFVRATRPDGIEIHRVIDGFPKPSCVLVSTPTLTREQVESFPGVVVSDKPMCQVMRQRSFPTAERWPSLKAVKFGSSVNGKDLWSFESGGPPGRTNVILVAGQHGDETAGPKLLFQLLDALESKNIVVPSHLNLIVVPLINPDGAHAGTRNNANNVDLNRDVFQRVVGQPETEAVKRLFLKHRPVRSVNFHGGILVVSYPFDDVFDLSPRDTDLRSYAQSYADAHPKIDRIINGAVWYVAVGSLDDWQHRVLNNLCVTAEISKIKDSPTENTLWQDNRMSIEATVLAHPAPTASSSSSSSGLLVMVVLVLTILWFVSSSLSSSSSPRSFRPAERL